MGSVSKFQGIFDVRDFGACNTRNDNQIPINEAITEATKTGKKVVIPDGEWRISDSIIIRENVKLEGHGRGYSTIILSEPGVDAMIETEGYAGFAGSDNFWYNEVQGVPVNWSVKDMSLDGANNANVGIRSYSKGFDIEADIIRCQTGFVTDCGTRQIANAVGGRPVVVDLLREEVQAFINISITECEQPGTFQGPNDAIYQYLIVADCRQGVRLSPGALSEIQQAHIYGIEDDGATGFIMEESGVHCGYLQVESVRGPGIQINARRFTCDTMKAFNTFRGDIGTPTDFAVSINASDVNIGILDIDHENGESGLQVNSNLVRVDNFSIRSDGNSVNSVGYQVTANQGDVVLNGSANRGQSSGYGPLMGLPHGATSGRPAFADDNQRAIFFDTSLNELIVWDGVQWNACGISGPV